MTDHGADEVRPHRALRVAERFRATMEPALRSRGWTAGVMPFVGYGGPGWVRVMARVILVPPGSPAVAEDGRGWRRFVSQSTSGTEVVVRVGNRTYRVTALGDGYVDVRLPADLPEGWASAVLSVDGSDPVEAPLRIVGPDTRLGVVSDIDDTVIVTMLPRPLVAFRNAFLTRESSRRAVPGMAALYREIVTAHPDVFFVYLSTGAWNTALALGRFLDRSGYPPGPLLLTDWGPTEHGWFRSGPDHKRAQLRRLFVDLPHLRWLLVGDDGQHDPSVYAEAAESAPDKVLGVAIRQLTLTQRVVGHGTPAPADGLDLTGKELPGDPVAAPDGAGLSRGLRERGLVLGADPL